MDCGTGFPIDGLRLTFPGEELRTLLDARRCEHEARAAHWKRELSRKPEDAAEDEPVLPDHMCKNQASEEEWLAEVMAFIRDHVEPEEVYRLGREDLEFGELLPEKPGWMKQDEYEERTALAFNLDRIAKKALGSPGDGIVVRLGTTLASCGCSANPRSTDGHARGRIFDAAARH